MPHEGDHYFWNTQTNEALAVEFLSFGDCAGARTRITDNMKVRKGLNAFHAQCELDAK